MTKFSELAEVTKVLLEREMDAHRKNVEHSRQIAGELAQLDMLRESAQADGASITARQVLGADALWQGWLVRKRAEIQRRAAMARAMEQETFARARLAFARVSAADSLVAKEKAERKHRFNQKEADRIDAIGTLRRAMAQKKK